MQHRKSWILFLGLIAGISLVTYWFVLPSITAHRFVATIVAEDYASADKMFADPDDRFLVQRFNHEDSWTFRARASIGPLTWSNLVFGNRIVALELAIGKPGRLQIRGWNLKATRTGLGAPEEDWRIFGGMVIAQQ
jgi:hypothetical protein